jgi:hypothetical protein
MPKASTLADELASARPAARILLFVVACSSALLNVPATVTSDSKALRTFAGAERIGFLSERSVLRTVLMLASNSRFAFVRDWEPMPDNSGLTRCDARIAGFMAVQN